MLRKYLLVWGLFHLFLALLGSLGVRVLSIPIVGPPLEYYRILTGSDRGFGFFAPKVIGEPIIKIEKVDKNNEKTEVPLIASLNRESQLRVSSALGSLATHFSNPELRRAIGASIAGNVLKNHSANKVIITWEHHHVPPLKDYKSGERPVRKQLYRVIVSNE